MQSLKNLVAYLDGVDDTEVFVLCSNKDMGGDVLSVKTDEWIDYGTKTKVFYNSNASITRSGIKKILDYVRPDVIFVNGLYSFPYTIYPLLYSSAKRKILSARGMLHPGALSQKSKKKKVFLTLFKLLQIHRRCEFHTTSDIETGYVTDTFGTDREVWMCPNLPNSLPYQQPLAKTAGELNLVSISLISPMKNILLVLEALKRCETNISYHIYGPVKDASYWSECKRMFDILPVNIKVSYKNELRPEDIPSVLTKYHCFILPSKSENFGHAIYEALSTGKPVITSHNTPWNGLEKANAGYNVKPEDVHVMAGCIDKLAMLNNEDYDAMTLAASKYVANKYNINEIQVQYDEMFALK